MDLTTWGRLSGVLYALPAERHADALAAAGVTRAAYDGAWGELGPQLSDPAAQARYTAAFREGLLSRVGEVRELTEDEYRAAEVARRLERPADHAELTPAQFLAAQYRWMDRLLADRRAAARMEATVLLAVHAAQGRYEVRPLPPPRLATRVRARRCPACGAPKLTEPRTPLIYCDRCGIPMGYDHEAARVVTHGLEPSFVFTTLVDGIRDELAACTPGDAAWADAWAWVYRTDMDLVPEGWTPRIRQPAFRDAMVAWSVRTTRVANEPEIRATRQRLEEAWLAAVAACAGWGEVPAAKKQRALLAHLRAADEALEQEIARFVALDLFVSHPDGLTPEVYRATHRGSLVDLWRPWLEPSLLDLVRRHVDGQEQWLDLPPTELGRSTCGSCGGALAVVEGARALVCEGCGQRLDAERPRFPCPGCGAGVVVVPHAHEIPCGHCGVVFLPG